MWNWRLLALGSAAVHGAAFVLLTVAILKGRRPPEPADDEPAG
jgi:hypothetical protein